MTHKLMIKTHVETGLKYLCYTQSEGKTYSKYKGSGKLWIRHLKKYGENITTELIFESDSYDEFKAVAIQKSHEFNVVEDSSWANLRIEEGDGGDTVSNKRWITNGQVDKYILKDLDIPEGWRAGRSRCVFNDPNAQREFQERVDYAKRGKSIKKAWDNGKMDKRDNTNIGQSNYKPEVKEKIRAALKGKSLTEEHKRNISIAAKNRRKK